MKKFNGSKRTSGYIGKYEPLYSYLAGREDGRVRLSFAEIEDILRFKLPKSASKYSAWWSSHETHPHCGAWTEAGYAVENATEAVRDGAVTFLRQ